MKKTLGIIGGMGPLATISLFDRIVALTNARGDQDHIHILIDSNPAIPDRTEAILRGSDAPYPFLLRAAQTLAAMGAQLLLIPCNTSHIYYNRLAQETPTPILNMVGETARRVAASGADCVGVLATDGTIAAGLYERALAAHGVRQVLPSPAGQREVMRMIYAGVKAGAAAFDTAPLQIELTRMVEEGAELFLLGCTELPIAFSRYHIPFPYVDSIDTLARQAILQAGYSLKEP